MLEVILFYFAYNMVRLWPIKGKSMEQLGEKELQLLEINYENYMNSSKGRKTPELTIEEYLPILQKQWKTYAGWVAIVIPIYVLVLFGYSSL